MSTQPAMAGWNWRWFDVEMPHTVGYRPDVDGLRAVAVLGVLFFHVWNVVPGGFVGVDIFFVISGYLITTIITRDVHNGEFRFKKFYERRARRILPALLCVYAATFVMCWFLYLPNDFNEFGQSLAASAVFASNVLFYKETGYSDLPAHFKPLLHTWSLSVEEQFYLIFPALLVIIHILLGKEKWKRQLFFGVAILASAGISEYQVRRSPSAAFYLIPSRFWELLLGGFIAITEGKTSMSAAAHEWMSTIGLSELSLRCSALIRQVDPLDCTPSPRVWGLL